MILESCGHVPGVAVPPNKGPILGDRQEVDGVADFHIAPRENIRAARSQVGWQADFVVFHLDDVAGIVHQDATIPSRGEELVAIKLGAKASVHGGPECEGTSRHSSNFLATLERDFVFAIPIEQGF